MKFLIVFACLLAVAFANEDANVLKNDAEVNVEDFKYSFELDNHVSAQQEGHLQDKDTWVVKGQNSHISPEGDHVSVQYIADENGYQVIAAEPPLPTPPPIPEAILKAIAYIQAHPSKDYKE